MLRITLLSFFPFVPCSQSKIKAKETIYAGFKNVKELGENFGLCPEIKNSEDYFVQGSISSPPTIDFTVYIFPCMGGSEDECINVEYLEELTVTVILPEVSFDPKKYKNPVKILPEIDTATSIHPNITQITKFKMKTSYVYDDKDNWSFKNYGKTLLRETFYEIDSLKVSLKSRAASYFCQPFDESTVKEYDPSGGYYDESGNWVGSGGTGGGDGHWDENGNWISSDQGQGYWDENGNWVSYDTNSTNPSSDPSYDPFNDPNYDPYNDPNYDPNTAPQQIELSPEEIKEGKWRKNVQRLIKIYQDRNKFKRFKKQREAQKGKRTLEDTKKAKLDNDINFGCEPLMIYQWNSGGRKTNLKRSYKKALDTVGELGGLAEALLSSAAVCYIIYTCTKMDSYVQKQLTRGKGADQAYKYSNLDETLTEKERKKKTEKALEELQMQRQDGLYLFKTLNHISAIEKSVFKNYHRVLIPLALINYNAKMIDKKANSSLKDDQEIHVDEIEDQISVEEALQMLKNDNSDGGLEKSLKLFLLENLPNDTTHVKDQSVFSQQSEDIGLKFEDVEEDENRIGKTGVIEAEQLNLKDSEENKKAECH